VSQKKWINIDYVSFGKVKATRKNTDYQNGTSCPKLKIFGKGGGGGIQSIEVQNKCLLGK
jgi:hypothetical protein